MKNEDRNVVKLEKVSKVYNGNEHGTAGVSSIFFSANKGELILFLGPSGSGKTTLLTLIAGLIKPTYGKVVLFNRRIDSYSKTELQKLRAERIGFIFQTFLLIDALTALENIKLVLKFGGKTGKTAGDKACQLLNQLGISYLSDKYPLNMSQGEKQRVAVARAMANDADLILADEPTASLEVHQGLEIIDLLHSNAKKENRCIIVASHDLRLKEYADRLIYLEDGKIKEFSNSTGEIKSFN